MSDNIPFSFQPKKALHQRNGSDELDVFEAARYFSGASENFTGIQKSVSDESRNFSITTQKHGMRPFGRMSLDMPKGNPIPLQAMLLESNPIMTNKEKKSKQPSSPGGKLAHFLNSLFNQTSSKKSKSSKTKSTKDEDESPSGWRRKRRSSISHFRSSNTSTTTIMHDSKSLFSTSSSSGYRTPPTYQEAHTPTKTTSYRDHFKSYSYLKPVDPPSQVTKAPMTTINGNFNKIDNANNKCDFIEKNTTFRNGFVEQEHHYKPHNNNNNKCSMLNEDTREFKRFIDDEDDGGDSDSSSDLFELSNSICDLGNYCSNGLPVFETTHMHSIKRGAPIDLKLIV